MGKWRQRSLERKNPLGIILIRAVGLAAGPAQLLWGRSGYPQGAREDKSEPEQVPGFSFRHSSRVHRLCARNFDPALGPAVPPDQTEGSSNLRKSSRKQNHLCLENIMAIQAASWAEKCQPPVLGGVSASG